MVADPVGSIRSTIFCDPPGGVTRGLRPRGGQKGGFWTLSGGVKKGVLGPLLGPPFGTPRGPPFWGVPGGVPGGPGGGSRGPPRGGRKSRIFVLFCTAENRDTEISHFWVSRSVPTGRVIKYPQKCTPPGPPGPPGPPRGPPFGGVPGGGPGGVRGGPFLTPSGGGPGTPRSDPL